MSNQNDDPVVLTIPTDTWDRIIAEGRWLDVIEKVNSNISDADLVQWFRSQGFEVELPEKGGDPQ